MIQHISEEIYKKTSNNLTCISFLRTILYQQKIYHQKPPIYYKGRIPNPSLFGYFFKVHLLKPSSRRSGQRATQFSGRFGEFLQNAVVFFVFFCKAVLPPHPPRQRKTQPLSTSGLGISFENMSNTFLNSCSF